jgi:hypothetical protein
VKVELEALEEPAHGATGAAEVEAADACRAEVEPGAPLGGDFDRRGVETERELADAGDREGRATNVDAGLGATPGEEADTGAEAPDELARR